MESGNRKLKERIQPMNEMSDVDEIERVIGDLIFFRERLYNGIYGYKPDSLTKAISLIRELESYRQNKKD